MKSFSFLVQLIIYSIIPLMGIFLWGWDWRELLVLFWLENITIGLTAVIRMARTKEAPPVTPAQYTNATMYASGMHSKFPRILFFVAHYGMFTFVHGTFLFALVSGDLLGQTMPPINLAPLLLFWAISGIVQVISSMVRPAPTTALNQQFLEPYKRIIPLHATLIAGVFAAITLGAPASALAVLIGIKLVIDIASYRSRKSA